MELCKGRPIDCSGRLEKEIRTYDFLDRLNISYERVDHDPAETMEACRAIDDFLAPAVMCKNLFLCNAQQTQFYLLMIRCDKKFKTKEISGQIQSARLSFASEEYMEKYLDITPGAVSALGLINDHENHVKLLVDEDILHSDYVGVHPCVNTSSLRIKTSDLFGLFLKQTNHTYQTVVLSETLIESSKE